MLEAIYATFAPSVYTFLRRRLRSAADARDLTQETFLAAFREEARGRYSGTSPMRSYLFGIAHNLVLHHFRAHRLRGDEGPPPAEDELEASVPCVDLDVGDHETQRILGAFLVELNDRERAFFKAHMMERPPRQVTASAFSMSIDQVRYLERKLQIRALRYLRRVGYLDAAGAQLRRAADRAEAAWQGA